jgi:hypothetical protein
MTKFLRGPASRRFVQMTVAGVLFSFASTACTSGTTDDVPPAAAASPTESEVLGTSGDDSKALGKNESPEAVEPTEEEPGPGYELIGASQYTMTTTTRSDGFEQVATMTLYPAIPGQDAARVQSAWEAVGGSGRFPCDDASVGTGQKITTPTSIFAVGTLFIENRTAEYGDGGIMWQFTAGMPMDPKYFAMGFGFSSGSSCRSLYGFQPIKPTWNSAKWGPVPVIVAYSGLVTPSNPEGDFGYIDERPIFVFSPTVEIVDQNGDPVDVIKLVPAAS